MTKEFSQIQFELLLPFQLRAIVAQRPVAYVPLGTLEWHCEHLPVGLDALTAHGLCLRAAARDGGVVLPPLYFGAGGEHGDYPWTVMMPTAREIETQLDFTIKRLKDFGFKLVVLFSGHCPPTQLEMIGRLAAKWAHDGFSVFATSVFGIEGLELGPDHAGLFETTLLQALWPELVQLARLPSLAVAPLAAGEDSFGAIRHDPKHPIWGVFGPDPRQLDLAKASPLLERSVTWLVEQVKSRFKNL